MANDNFKREFRGTSIKPVVYMQVMSSEGVQKKIDLSNYAFHDADTQYGGDITPVGSYDNATAIYSTTNEHGKGLTLNAQYPVDGKLKHTLQPAIAATNGYPTMVQGMYKDCAGITDEDGWLPQYNPAGWDKTSIISWTAPEDCVITGMTVECNPVIVERGNIGSQAPPTAFNTRTVFTVPELAFTPIICLGEIPAWDNAISTGLEPVWSKFIGVSNYNGYWMFRYKRVKCKMKSFAVAAGQTISIWIGCISPQAPGDSNFNPAGFYNAHYQSINRFMWSLYSLDVNGKVASTLWETTYGYELPLNPSFWPAGLYTASFFYRFIGDKHSPYLFCSMIDRQNSPTFLADTLDPWLSGPLKKRVSTCTTFSPIDLGYAPSNAPIVVMDAYEPAGSSIAITGEHSVDNVTWAWIGGGTPTQLYNGISLPTSQYFRFTITLSNGISPSLVPMLKTFGVAVGAADYYGTERNVPFVGVLPYLKGETITSLSQDIKFMEASTIGQITPQLQLNEHTSELLADGRMKNRVCSVYLGTANLAASEFEQVYSGVWHDASIDNKNQVIKPKFRDVFKQLSKLKIPKEDSINNNDVSRIRSIPVLFSGNAIDIMIEILETYGGIPTYRIDTGSFTDIKTAYRNGTTWDCYREFIKPYDAIKMLVELQVITGTWIIEGADGRFKLKIYNPASAGIATLSAKKYSFGEINLNQADLYPTTYVYYNPIAGKEGASAENFTNLFMVEDMQAVGEWGEYNQKEFYENWKCGGTAVTPIAIGNPPETLFPSGGLAHRMQKFFARPRATVPVSGVPIFNIEVEPGDVVCVDDLYMPLTGNAYNAGQAYVIGQKTIYNGWVYECIKPGTGKVPGVDITYWAWTGQMSTGYTNQKKFLVMSRSVNVGTKSINYNLWEVPV
jgi:hypothetical protein